MKHSKSVSFSKTRLVVPWLSVQSKPNPLPKAFPPKPLALTVSIGH